ncbi:MAG: peptide deformylase [Candidatus Sericytochromatia bacterium]|nr:peptide deformylase [Candidatus Sericytochromatia bacterium]
MFHESVSNVMPILEIRTIGDPVLRQVAEPVRKVNAQTKQLIADMFETMYAAEGVGLAAPQVGISQRLFVIDVGDGEPFALVNPILVKGWNPIQDQEGCLSVPGVYMEVTRYERVLFKGRDEKDRAVQIEATGLLARALQHELDHLDGKIFVDLIEDKMAVDAQLAAMKQRLAEKALAVPAGGQGDTTRA